MAVNTRPLRVVREDLVAEFTQRGQGTNVAVTGTRDGATQKVNIAFTSRKRNVTVERTFKTLADFDAFLADLQDVRAAIA